MKKSTKNILSVVLSIVITFVFITTLVQSATTISTDISTGGTLTVTGDTTLGTDLYILGADIYLGTGSATSTLTSAGGNLGIGTTSPYATLSVVGQIVSEYFTATSTTATSTFFGSITGGNNLVIMESGDIGNANRSVDFADTDPRLRIYSSDEAQANDYIEMYHDQINAILVNGIGELILRSVGGAVRIDSSSGKSVYQHNNISLLNVRTSSTFVQAMFAVEDLGGNQIVITNDVNGNKDHDRPLQTNPTLYVFSDLDPDIDNTEWMSLSVTSTSTSGTNTAYGLIETGTGHDLIFNPTGGNVGIGTTTPNTMFQVATSTANATTTVEFGKTGQNKGSCLKMYDDAGAVKYVSINGTSFVISATSCE